MIGNSNAGNIMTGRSVVACTMSALLFLLPGVFCHAAESITISTGMDSTPNLSLLKETRHSLEAAYLYLQGEQRPDGSWKGDPAITALVLYAFLLRPEYNPDAQSQKALTRGLAFVEKYVKPDGGIYHEQYLGYTTSVCLLALTESRLTKYRQIIANAKKYLIKFQIDEDEGYAEEHPYYGGIGYGGDDRPDLSNTQLALEAIKAAEDYETWVENLLTENADQIEREETELGLHWQKALVFLARCQNVKAVNDMPYAEDNGGFIYETGHYKTERSHSYGSMTYAGVKSLLYARLTHADIRVKRAVNWIKSHYTLEENPGFGDMAMYYYYMTFAKCLDALGQEVIQDSHGKEHHWRQELIAKLLSLQNGDGYWENSNARFWENIKELVTAYAVIGIKFALKEMIPAG